MIKLTLKETLYGNFLLKDGDYVDEKIRGGEFFDPFLKTVFDHYLNSSSVVLDIGAYCGFHSVYLSKKVKQVYSFEPQLYIYYQLCGNLFINECYNVKAYNLAVSSKPCKMSIANEKSQLVDIVKKDDLIDYSQMKNSAGISFQENKKGEVEAIAIDSLELKELDLLKIDSQGMDLEVLKGARETIKKFRPIICFEIEFHKDIHTSKRKDYNDFFKKLDYKIKLLPGSTADYIAIPVEEYE